MEILQQQARIDDPDAWVRKQRSYRVRGEAPMPSDPLPAPGQPESPQPSDPMPDPAPQEMPDQNSLKEEDEDDPFDEGNFPV